MASSSMTKREEGRLSTGRAVVVAATPLFSSSAMDAAQKRGVGMTPFDRAEGAEPIMDVIRTRRA